MVELLTDRQWNSISIIKRTAPRGEHGPLGTLPLRLLSPAVSLEELKLGRTSEDSRNAKQ